LHSIEKGNILSQDLSRIDALFAKIQRGSDAASAASAAGTTSAAPSHANREDQVEAATPQQQVTPSGWARIMREWVDSFEQAMNEAGHADLTGTFEEMHEAFYAYAEALHKEAAKTKGD
jgi:hypothetical protein